MNTNTSLASLADLSDDSAIEVSNTPTAPVPDANYPVRHHSRSTGDLISTIQNPPQPFHRQLSAVEVQTNYMKDLLPSVKKSSKEFRKSREEDAPFFAPGSTPQYKVIYKDLCEVVSCNGSSHQGSCDKRRSIKPCLCLSCEYVYVLPSIVLSHLFCLPISPFIL